MEEVKPKEIFVFGSNEAGKHGRGAAKYALDYCGAEYGVGIGRTGDAYGIPTKDRDILTLPIEKVYEYIEDFLTYAANHPELTFKVTAIGTGLANFGHEEIADRFYDATSNCLFDECWRPWLGEGPRYWGTYE